MLVTEIPTSKELIKNLAEQSYTSIRYEPNRKVISFSEDDLTKFVNLIIKECLTECWYDATPKQIADNIRNKFGITE